MSNETENVIETEYILVPRSEIELLYRSMRGCGDFEGMLLIRKMLERKEHICLITQAKKYLNH